LDLPVGELAHRLHQFRRRVSRTAGMLDQIHEAHRNTPLEGEPQAPALRNCLANWIDERGKGRSTWTFEKRPAGADPNAEYRCKTRNPAPLGSAGPIGSGGFSRAFLFQGNRYGCIRRQAHLLPFDVGDQPQIDEMMMAFVASFAAIGLGELDPATFNAIDGPEVNAVCADHLHVLLYLVSPHSSRRLSLRELIAPPGQEFE